jgi:ABC-type branched-subunit amino acid transport system substrate-binding protein
VLATFTLSNAPSTSTGTGIGVPQGAAGPLAQGPSGPQAVTQPGTQAVGLPSAAPGGKTQVGGVTYDCSKGQNAGATEVGVSAHEIRFAATVVKSGIAKDFLSDAQYAMQAVVNKVNRQGGVCGRIIAIDYNDDGWDPQQGNDLINKYIGAKKYFGLAVNPSSEGVRGSIDNNKLTDSQFPLIGSDGQLIDQYLTKGGRAQPWVWPVATSTASVMHIMARNAYERGARKFGIVYDQNYRFGVEGHVAFVGAVKRLGGTISVEKGVQGGQQDYANDVNDFIGKCGGSGSLKDCDFIAMLLEPATASRWVGGGGLGNGVVRPKVGIGAPQPLFVNSFARDCGKYCANLWVWTSFKPPIPPFDTDPAVAMYRDDLKTFGGNPNADANNPHVEGAYIGMQLLVEALKRLGPAPTRLGIKAVLDAMSFDAKLCPLLTFTASNHFSNVSAQAFEAIVNNGSFANWRYTNSGFIADKEVGKDIAG